MVCLLHNMMICNLEHKRLVCESWQAVEKFHNFFPEYFQFPWQVSLPIFHDKIIFHAFPWVWEPRLAILTDQKIVTLENRRKKLCWYFLYSMTYLKRQGNLVYCKQYCQNELGKLEFGLVLVDTMDICQCIQMNRYCHTWKQITKKEGDGKIHIE